VFNLDSIKNETKALQQDIEKIQENKIQGMPLGDYIFNKVITRVDPVEYCERVLRNHLPREQTKLHENQRILVRAVTDPKIRKVAALMSRQAGKTESIASFTGFLLDNYPGMRVGIFTPRIQQAQIDLGRTKVFFQMNEGLLNNEIVKVTKDKLKLSNGSYAQAVSGSDQSNIEGLTFDVIILDEAQKITDYTWSERIAPMGGATNAKMIKIGTPKTKNHFFESMKGSASEAWECLYRDWTECEQLWVLNQTVLPDHTDPESGRVRPYSTYVLGLMPKSLKQEYFPKNPEIWTEGEMSVQDFRTQYMLNFVASASKFFKTHEIDKLKDGDFHWLESGRRNETYVAGIDFAGSSAGNADYTHISVMRVNDDGTKEKVWGTEFRGKRYPEQIKEIASIFGGPRPKFMVKSIFADYTGCGRPVIQTLQDEYGLQQLEGITFNAKDTYTNSGMNMKNIMYAKFKHELNYDRVKYPNQEKFLETAGSDKKGFYHKMIGEWSDLEMEMGRSINKRIEAPSGGHDDVCDADALANFAALNGQQNRGMPKPSQAKISRF
jgi:hypothetical protein